MNATALTSDAQLHPVRDRILDVIARELRRPAAVLSPEATLEDLEIDSLATVMILNGIEDEFGVYVPVESELAGVTTLGGFLSVVERLVGGPSRA